jgi:hypothetical protein
VLLPAAAAAAGAAPASAPASPAAPAGPAAPGPVAFAPAPAPAAFALAPAPVAPAAPGLALGQIFHFGVLHQRQQQEYFSFLCSQVPAAVQQDQAVRERFLREQWENELASREAQRRMEVENLHREVARLQAQNRDVLEHNRQLREEQDRLKGRMLDAQRLGAQWRKEAMYVFLTLTYHFLN